MNTHEENGDAKQVNDFVANKRTWILSIDYRTIRVVKKTFGIYLPSLIDDKFVGLQALFGDLEGFINLLFVLCQEQAAKLGISDEDFGEGLGGTSLLAAQQAFTRELIDFFPDPEIRKGLGEILAKGKKVFALVVAKDLAKLDQVSDADLAAMVVAEREKASLLGLTSSSSSGDTPASSG